MKRKLYEIADGSYSLGSSYEGENGLSHVNGIGFVNRPFKVIARNCVLPAHNYSEELKTNDTIVQDVNNGDIIFTQWGFLRPLTGTCPHCGESIKEN